MKKRTKIITIILAVVMLIALIMAIKPVADTVGDTLGVASDKIVYWAKTILIAAIGMWLIYSGIAALAFPIVGIILIGIGLFLLGYALYPLFSTSNNTPER